MTVLPVFGTALIGALAGTWISMHLARRLGVVDIPGGVLKPHLKSTPRLGGLGIALGVLTATVIGLVQTRETGILLPVIIANLMILVTGAVDDVVSITPAQKFSGQLLGGLLLVVLGLPLATFPSLLLALPLTMFGTALLPNAINLIDGMDGLAGGVSLVMGVGFLGLGLIWNDPVVMVMATATIGGCLGFLAFNLHPARTFMGDAGSLFLGGWFFTMVARLSLAGNYSQLLICLTVLAVPLYDTGLGIFRRWLRKVPLFAGDRNHIYDQWYRRSRSTWGTLVSMWGFALVVTLLAWGAAILDGPWAWGTPLLAAIGLGALTWQQRFLVSQSDLNP